MCDSIWTTVAVVIATIVGPIAAVQVQKFIERRTEVRRRKDQVFYTLMSLRAARLHPDFVRALNTIDFAFHAGKPRMSRTEKLVIDRWRDYLHHVNQRPTDAEQKQWSDDLDKIVVNLLQAMAEDLNYPFDRETIRSGGYATRASTEHENELTEIRRLSLALLQRKITLPVSNYFWKDGKLVAVKLPGMNDVPEPTKNAGTT